MMIEGNKIGMVVDGNIGLMPLHRQVTLAAKQFGFDIVPIMFHFNHEVYKEAITLIHQYFGNEYQIPNLTEEEREFLIDASLMSEELVLFCVDKKIEILSLDDICMKYISIIGQSKEYTLDVPQPPHEDMQSFVKRCFPKRRKKR